MCDRVYVMCNGRVTGCLNREEASQERILNLSMEHSSNERQEEAV
jgi:rhamnose transport system ATP-binding protein